MRFTVIRALSARNFRGTFTDKGRVSELVIFPLSFLVIWGLFFRSGVVDRNLARQLLVINLIWSIAGTFQTQANLTLMFDLWSREFTNILRQGVRIGEMVLAHFIFSTALGLLNLFLFLFFIVVAFGGSVDDSAIFFKLFPLYYTSAIGLAAMFGGIVMMLGRSYAFISWTGLQLLIMISSPFSPLATLPWGMRFLARLSPYTYIFEFVRSGRDEDYWIGLGVAFLYLFLGCTCALFFYRLRRSGQGLMGV